MLSHRISQLSGPVKIGLGAALVAWILVIIGIVQGRVPANPLSILLAFFISGISWFVVAWAIATAVQDVDEDLVS